MTCVKQFSQARYGVLLLFGLFLGDAYRREGVGRHIVVELRRYFNGALCGYGIAVGRLACEHGAGGCGGEGFAVGHLYGSIHGYGQQVDELDDEVAGGRVVDGGGGDALAHIVAAALYPELTRDVLVAAVVAEYLLGVVAGGEVDAR